MKKTQQQQCLQIFVRADHHIYQLVNNVLNLVQVLCDGTIIHVFQIHKFPNKEHLILSFLCSYDSPGSSIVCADHTKDT